MKDLKQRIGLELLRIEDIMKEYGLDYSLQTFIARKPNEPESYFILSSDEPLLEVIDDVMAEAAQHD